VEKKTNYLHENSHQIYNMEVYRNNYYRNNHLCSNGQIDIAVKVLSADFFIKLAGFYIHEKLWEIKK